MKRLIFLAVTTVVLLPGVRFSFADTDQSKSLVTAAPKEISVAMGHYERARSLLLAALREFDLAYKIAKSDQIINPETWRSSVITRAEEIEHLVSPRPRTTEGGARFEPDPRLLGLEAKKKK